MGVFPVLYSRTTSRCFVVMYYIIQNSIVFPTPRRLINPHIPHRLSACWQTVSDIFPGEVAELCFLHYDLRDTGSVFAYKSTFFRGCDILVP
jgi:hypothetical protein